MKKSPSSIERNANASAQQTRADSANAAGIIFHSKPTENQATKGNAMPYYFKIEINQLNKTSKTLIFNSYQKALAAWGKAINDKTVWSVGPIKETEE